MKTRRSHGYAFLAGIALLVAIQGCGDDDNDNEKPPVVNPTAGSSGKGSTGGSKNTAGDGPAPEGGSGGTGNTSATAGDGPVNPIGGNGGEGGDGPVQPACTLPELGEDGCFNCPTNGVVEEWFNRCVDSDCEPFDNSRLPLLKADGSLPPLPT